MNSVLAVIAAYLLGSLSFAVIVSRMLGLPDPRSYGSGNPGATNVLRSGSKLAAALTLIGDLLKGWAAVALAKMLMQTLDFGDATIAAVAVAVMVGHLLPAFFQFKGGKGVATALGVVLALSWPTGLIGAGVWITTALLSRYSSLAALLSAAVAPLVAMHFLGRHTFVAAITLIAILVIVRHYGNIQKLLAGSESRIGQK